jgi:hypothetical protein
MRNSRGGMVYVVLMGLFGCYNPTRPDTVDHLTVVQAEWKIAQDFFAPVIGNKVYNVGWERFGWESHNGPFDCGKWSSVNGCLDGSTIHWNIHTPGAIRHEAAHAILKKLGHMCRRWVSLDGPNLTVHCCYDKDSNYKPCKRWIEENF